MKAADFPLPAAPICTPPGIHGRRTQLSRLETVAKQCRAAPAILLAEGDLEKVLHTVVESC